MPHDQQFTLHDLSPRLTREHFQHAARTAVAAGLTLALVRLIGLKFGYWAVISSVIVIQARLGASVRESWSRVAGTGMGAAMGIVCGMALGNGLLSVMLAVFLAVTVCSAVPWLRPSMRIGAITVLIVMLAEVVGSPPLWSVGLERFMEIALGIGVALVVSFFVFPARAARDAALGLAHGLALDSMLLETVYLGAFEPEYPENVVRIVKGDVLKTRLLNRQLLVEARREPGAARAEGTARLLELEVRTYENILSMDHAARELDPSGYRTNIAKPLNALAEAVCENLEYLAALSRHRVDPLPTPPLSPPDLTVAIGRVEKALQQLREERTSGLYPLNEMIHFFTFLHGLMEIARDLNGRVDHPDRAA